MAAPRGDQISVQEVLIFRVFKKKPKTWFSNVTVASAAGVVDRTVRFHTSAMHRKGLLEQLKMAGGYRYRWNPEGEKRKNNKKYLAALEAAGKVV